MDTNTIFSTEFNYQKIASKGSRTDSCAGGTNTTISIPHGLGRISSARVWYDPGTGKRFPASFWQYDDDSDGTIQTSGITVRSVYMTATDLVITYSNFVVGAINVTTYYRVYYDS